MSYLIICSMCGEETAAKTNTKKYCDSCRKVVSSKTGKLGSEIAIKNNNWSSSINGRRKTKQGYIIVKTQDGRWLGEHRYIMEQKLGRQLRQAESVHHINGIRDDNRLDNLELWVGPIRYGQRASDIKCHHCGEPYKID